MNKFVVSVGLAATGMMAIETTASAQYSLLGDTKNWNASGSLRGFYDSNYAIGPSKAGSYGLEVSPTITATIPLTQTQIGFLYTYGLQWYEARQNLGVDAYDQSHSFNVWVDHAFNERWNVKIIDSLNIGQEPELLQPGTGTPQTPAVTFRIAGDNLANNATVTLHTDWTRQFSTELFYSSGFYQYSSQSTYAPQLDRIDNTPGLDLQWHFTPELTGFVGYQFQDELYTDGAPIGNYGPPEPGFPNGKGVYWSNSRDNLNHYGYVGVSDTFLPNLTGSARVGVQVFQTINDPVGDSTTTSPYADLNLVYTYLPGDNVELGFTETRNPTDVVSVNSQNYSITQDQLSSTLYLALNHHITHKLLFSAIGKFCDSSYNGGQFDNQTQTLYSLGLNANYAFTRHFSAEAGFNYDDNSAPAGTGQSYTRDRYYIGISVAY